MPPRQLPASLCPRPTPTARSPGILARLGAVVALSIMFALVKLATSRGVGIVETVFYRQLFALPVIGSWIALGPGRVALRTSRPGRTWCGWPWG